MDTSRFDMLVYLISSIVVMVLTISMGIHGCFKKNATKTTTRTITRTTTKEIQSGKVKEYPKAPPIKHIPLAPQREDDDTLRDVQSIKKDDASDNK